MLVVLGLLHTFEEKLGIAADKKDTAAKKRAAREPADPAPDAST